MTTTTVSSDTENILSDSYKQYIEDSLDGDESVGEEIMENLHYYRDLAVKLRAGERPPVFLRRSLLYVSADSQKVPNFVTGKSKPPLAFRRRYKKNEKKKILDILDSLHYRTPQPTFDLKLGNGLKKPDPHEKIERTPFRRLGKISRSEKTLISVNKRGRINKNKNVRFSDRCGIFENDNTDLVMEDVAPAVEETPLAVEEIPLAVDETAQAFQETAVDLDESAAEDVEAVEMEELIPENGEDLPEKIPIHPADILAKTGELDVIHPVYKYMGKFDREKEWPKISGFFRDSFFQSAESSEHLLKMFPVECPALVNYTIVGVPASSSPGIFVDRNSFEIVVKKKVRAASYDTSDLESPFFTFRRKTGGNSCILCEKKFNKLYYLLIHYNTCYPRLNFLVRIPNSIAEIEKGFQIIITQNSHYSMEHYENFRILPGEAPNRYDPHFFTKPWDKKLLKNHVHLDLTTFVSDFEDTEQMFPPVNYPLRNLDYYHHRMLVEYSGIDGQTAALQLLWVEFIYLLSVETYKTLSPYLLYRLFIKLNHNEIHDMNLLPAMGNHIQYYTKKKKITRELGREIVFRLNGRRKVPRTPQLESLLKKTLYYVEESRKRRQEGFKKLSFKSFIINPLTPDVAESKLLIHTVSAFPFGLLEDTKYSITAKVLNITDNVLAKDPQTSSSGQSTSSGTP